MLYSFHFYPTRQRIADGRMPLRWSRLLLASCSQQQRNDEENERSGWFIQRISPVHQIKKQRILWLFLTESIVIFFFPFLIPLQWRAVRVERRFFFLMETPGTECPSISGRGATPASTHLPVRNRPQLREILYVMQLRLCHTSSTNWCK